MEKVLFSSIPSNPQERAPSFHDASGNVGDRMEITPVSCETAGESYIPRKHRETWNLQLSSVDDPTLDSVILRGQSHLPIA